MKRVIALALAATLLGSTAASAQGWGHHYRGHGWHHGYHRGNGDAAAAIGLGIFALGALAIISSQNAHRYDGPAYDGYGPPPPPPPPDSYGPPDGYSDGYYDDDAD